MDNVAKIALGRVAAIERVAAVLILTHPAPDAFRAAWKELGPALRQDLERDFQDDPHFLQAALAAMDRFDRTVQRVHAASAPPGSPTNQ